MIKTSITLIRLAHAITLVLSGLLTAQAAPFAVDNFSTYVDGALDGQSGSPVGFTGSWSTIALDNGGYDIVDQQLVATLDGNSFATRQLEVNSLVANDGDSVYASMRFQGSNLNPSAILDFTIPVLGPQRVWGFGIGLGPAGTAFMLSSGGTAGAVKDATEYLIVSRLTRNDSGDDEAVMWVDPASESDSPLLTAHDSFLDTATIGLDHAEFISLGNSSQVLISEIRIATSFAGVVPEPMSLPQLWLCTMLVRRLRVLSRVRTRVPSPPRRHRRAVNAGAFHAREAIGWDRIRQANPGLDR